MTRAEARKAIRAEMRLLEDSEDRGERTAPLGGWRNTAVATVAERLAVNPYALDRLARGPEHGRL